MQEETKGAFKEDVLAYAKEKFGSEPEYLWARFPGYCVLRDEKSNKWYAILADVPRSKLGLSGNERVYMLGVKCDLSDREFLLTRPGIVPAYHLNRENWIGVLLDGSADLGLTLKMLSVSRDLVLSGGKRKRSEPIAWLVPSNPKYFDLLRAFEKSETLTWPHAPGLIAGDVVYFYVTAPVSAVMLRCVVTNVEKTDVAGGKNVVATIRFTHRYDDDEFTIDFLRSHGVKYVRGPRSIPFGVLAALEKAAQNG